VEEQPREGMGRNEFPEVEQEQHESSCDAKPQFMAQRAHLSAHTPPVRLHLVDKRDKVALQEHNGNAIGRLQGGSAAEASPRRRARGGEPAEGRPSCQLTPRLKVALHA